MARLTLRRPGIDDNQLGAVPDELAGFPRLERLGLSGDALTALPPSIGALTSLETLALCDNAIIALPAELSQLTRLRVLYIKGNPLPPSELERLRAALPAVTLNIDTPNEVYLHL